MRVILNEAEILMALEDFVLATVTVPDDVRIDIDLKATRGENGYTAEIDLVDHNNPGATNVDAFNATDEAVEEGLGIVEKIEAAKANAKAPRRRGRPAGSKNKATLEREAQAAQASPAGQTGTIGVSDTGLVGVTAEQEEANQSAALIDEAVAEHPAHETSETTETVEPTEQTEGPLTNPENGNTVTEEDLRMSDADFAAKQNAESPAVASDEVAAPAATEEVQQIDENQKAEELAPETLQPEEPKVKEINESSFGHAAPEAAASDMSEQTRTRPSLFGNLSDAADPAPEPEKVELVEEPAPNSEEALAAEAAATEPAEDDEDIDYSPTVETSTVDREDDDVPAPKPTRSLFADLNSNT